MEEFMIQYADAFYKALERIAETIRIIVPIAITIAMLVAVPMFMAGLIVYIYEEIKRRAK